MKIIFSSNFLRDLVNFRAEAIQSFVDQGYDVVLVAPPCDKNIVPSYSPKIKVVEVQMDTKGTNPLNDLKYLRSLKRIYKRERPDYIFHFTIKPNIYGTLAAKLLGIPSSAMIAGLGHVYTEGGLGNKLARAMYKFAMRFPQRVLVLNQANYAILLQKKVVNKERLVLLSGGEGVNLSHFRQLPMPQNENPVFLLISRVLYEKGYSEYVEVGLTLKGQAEFRLMGFIDTHPSAVSEQTIERDVAQGAICYLGFSPDVLSQIAQADCIVLPSYHEGLSRVLIEAAACGRPIITTDIAGCRETVDHGVNGFLVPKKDAQALTFACEKFVSLSSPQKQAMADASRVKAEREFDVTKVIDVYHNIIENAIR